MVAQTLAQASSALDGINSALAGGDMAILQRKKQLSQDIASAQSAADLLAREPALPTSVPVALDTDRVIAAIGGLGAVGLAHVAVACKPLAGGTSIDVVCRVISTPTGDWLNDVVTFSRLCSRSDILRLHQLNHAPSFSCRLLLLSRGFSTIVSHVTCCTS